MILGRELKNSEIISDKFSEDTALSFTGMSKTQVDSFIYSFIRCDGAEG